MDPYQILGVSPTASDDDIKRAYRALIRKYHPDANINNPNRAEAEEKFKQVQQAYETIMYSRQRGEAFHNRATEESNPFNPYNDGAWYVYRSSSYRRPYENYSRWCLDLFLMNLFCGCCC